MCVCVCVCVCDNRVGKIFLSVIKTDQVDSD